jgi:hypothetical protein
MDGYPPGMHIREDSLESGANPSGHAPLRGMLREEPGLLVTGYFVQDRRSKSQRFSWTLASTSLVTFEPSAFIT